MLFDSKEPDSVWVCDTAWDVYTSQKLMKPSEEKIQEYKNMDLHTLMHNISKLERVIGDGIGGKRRKAPNALNLQPSIRVPGEGY